MLRLCLIFPSLAAVCLAGPPENLRDLESPEPRVRALQRARLAAQLERQLVQHHQTRGADRVAARNEAAGEINGQFTIGRRRTRCRIRSALAPSAEPEVLE